MRQVTKTVTAATEEAAAALSIARESLLIQLELHEQAMELIRCIATETDSIQALRNLVRLKELLRYDELERIEQALQVIQRESLNYRAAPKEMYAISLKHKTGT